jgi:hypothetical protein
MNTRLGILVGIALFWATAPASAASHTAGGAYGAHSAAPSASRQTGTVTFSSRTPGTATGLSESAVYVNPTDPSAKPPAVRETVTTFASGFQIDTSVPAQCTASDQTLQAEGDAACPAASRVGGGSATLATGLSGPGASFPVDIDAFNDRDQIVFIFKAHGTGAVAGVVRGMVEHGETLATAIPSEPGGPPDFQSSLKQIQLNLDRITVMRGGRVISYLRTPPRCPSSDQWVSHTTFTYSDGVSQTLAASTPCTALITPGRLGCPRPSGRLAGRSLGPVMLGMTRRRARSLFRRYSTRGHRYMDFFCLAGGLGIRVGYPSPKLLRTLSPATRRRERGRVVWASTSSPYYALHGVHPGARLAKVARHLGTGKGVHIGLNWWYLAANGPSRGVLKVRHGVIEEIGIASKQLTNNPRAAWRFLTSFG